MHSFVLDLSDERWKKYFNEQETDEMVNYNNKKFSALPTESNNFIVEARKFVDAESLKEYLKQNFRPTACEWAKENILTFLHTTVSIG